MIVQVQEYAPFVFMFDPPRAILIKRQSDELFEGEESLLRRKTSRQSYNCSQKLEAVFALFISARPHGSRLTPPRHLSTEGRTGRAVGGKRGDGRGRLGAVAAKSGIAWGTGEFYKWIITAEEGLNSRRHCLVRREETARRTVDNGQARLRQVGLDNSSCKVLGELHWVLTAANR